MVPDAKGSPTKSTRGIEGRLLFRFGVVTDTHVNHEENATTSPWPVNKLANGRVRHAFRTIGALRPEFMVHVGDMVHPTPTSPHYRPAVEQFRKLAGEVRCPIHLTPGNHDIGDKTIEWAPARPITAETLAIYEASFGKSYYGFAHGDCHFLVLNSLLIGSRLEAEADQWSWLEKELARNRNRRTFAFIHDPPFTTDPDEADSYDNIPEAGRRRLVELLTVHKTEAVFSGHVHNFWYNCVADTKLYILPSTTFVRQDYSELYKVEAGPEGGRNDAAKLGVAVVDVYAHGHVLHVVRTNGLTAEAGSLVAPAAPVLEQVHSKLGLYLPVGVDLRHPWAEVVEIAPSSGVDEFGRKRARNDYPLQALWEMGISKLRVPVQDLADDLVRTRMRAMAEIGHEFTVYSYDIPRGAQLKALVEHADLVSVWELILPRSRVEARLGALAAIKASRSIQIHYSILRAVDEAASSGKHFAHAINHGLAFDEIRGMETALRESRFRHAIDGLSYRIPRDGRPDIELPAISEFCSQQGMDCSIHVRLAAEDPAQSMCNDLANANRVAETLFASVLVRPGTGIFLDTFDDVDRSFFRRNGLCDRRFNPRMAGRVFRHLQAALPRRPTGARPINLKVGGVTGMEIANAVWILAAAPSELDVRQLRLALGEASTQPTGDIVDLASGERSALSAAPERLVISNPTLVILSRVEPAGCAQPSGLDT